MMSSNHNEGHWLYLKIYTGIRTADHILLELLYPECLECSEKGIAAEWFFIRYNDPEFHLRFRMRFHKDLERIKFVKHLTKMIDPLLKTGLVWNLESAVYVPEYERYGWNSMRFAEQIFCADSNAFLRFLSIEQELDQHSRWLNAVASVDRLLKDFAFEADQRKNLLLYLSRKFGHEFGKDKSLADQLSNRYRKFRYRIMELLSDDEILINKILANRSVEQNAAVSSILNLYKTDKMLIRKNDLLSSFIHMSLNRIFRNNNRLYEMVIYDLLFRAYKEQYFRSLPQQ